MTEAIKTGLCEQHWERLRKELYERGYEKHMAGDIVELCESFDGKDIAIVAMINMIGISINLQAITYSKDGCPICGLVNKIFTDSIDWAAQEFEEKH